MQHPDRGEIIIISEDKDKLNGQEAACVKSSESSQINERNRSAAVQANNAGEVILEHGAEVLSFAGYNLAGYKETNQEDAYVQEGNTISENPEATVQISVVDSKSSNLNAIGQLKMNPINGVCWQICDMIKYILQLCY